VLACLWASLGLAAHASASTRLPHGSPFAGTALWITQLDAQSTPQALGAQALAAGAHTVFVKAGDGSTANIQFSPVLLGALRAAGLSVCAWTFAYGQDPLAEAAVAVSAVRAGAQCLVVDAEGQYDGRYGAAQVFLRALRTQLGSRFPIGLAGQAEVSEHPTFPYSVFLGPGGFDVDMPQMYWLELGVSVDSAYAATLGVNSIYGRPILPVGQLAGVPSAAELTRFRALSGAYGSPGLSFFSLDVAQPQELAALASPFPALARRAIVAPTLHPGADEDEVLWAQELLNAAGAHLPMGGFYGAQTARALTRFQRSHRLPPNGILGPASWKALERLHAREPSWAGGPPDSAR
jgi:Putative peptidoglycan binding domain